MSGNVGSNGGVVPRQECVGHSGKAGPCRPAAGKAARDRRWGRPGPIARTPSKVYIRTGCN
jgi:hypothetical protein